MKKKLTTLMFGLLLAVGWTSSASAQALGPSAAERFKFKPTVEQKDYTVAKEASVKAPDQLKAKAMPMITGTIANAPRRAADDKMKCITGEDAAKLTYTWTDAQGTVHENTPATEEATEPEQMYELLRFVYSNPAFPGPYYSAYKADGTTREDPVYYGGIAGGWNIGTNYSALGDITINIAHNYSGYFTRTYYEVLIKSIKVMSDNTVITEYDIDEANGTNTTDWTVNGSIGYSADNEFAFVTVDTQGNVTGIASGGSFTIPASLLTGYGNVQVVIEARSAENYYAGTISVNGSSQTISYGTTSSNYTWSVAASSTLAPDGTFKPTEEGYTALVVSLFDDATMMQEPSDYSGSCEFTTKEEVINYFKTRVKSIKLLTDGVRIGSEDDKSSGTVFSCDGTYNKFFFLGKGQARKKAPRILERIASSSWNWPSYTGEEVAFKEMFEEFSPTSGDEGSQIKDFYSKMNEGNVYDVVHDCASVIQNGHQFSMSGNDGKTSYAMTGLNFFIPDYRLLWWSTSQTYNNRTYTVDGRDMNAYESTNTTTGDHGSAFVNANTTYSYFSAYYAQYNQAHAPKVGIYRITLDATATQVAQIYAPGNRNYAVTLTWVSSLDEMSGHKVPQTYTVYYFDENGNRQHLVVEGVTTTDGQTGETTLTYYVEQHEHSYTIDYIVEGSPDDTEHPQFVAVSNIDGVVIPGWDDFVGLELDHHESDFVVADMANWYRNFLAVVNEDLYNGLTVSAVTGADGGTPMSTFNLYRYNYKGTQASGAETKIATLELFNATPTKVDYRVTYVEDENQRQEILEGEAGKYSRQAMSIPDEGEIRVRGNGDLVIWPNNYYVNFKSITVKNGNSTVASWNADSYTDLPNGWKVSPGSKWEEFSYKGDKVGYMEGGGYIYIPNMLNQYNNLSVEIQAYGEASNVKRIAVNDQSKDITATAAGTTYTWTSPNPNAAPKRATERGTSTLTFTAACGGSGTADDGAAWTVTSDASESNFDSTKGIHYGTGSASVSYIQLSTSSIPGTIKKVVVNASTASGVTATASVTVGGNAFGTAQSLSTTATDYTFEGNASGQIVVRIAKASSATKALYCKSIAVTYETESGSEETTTANLTVCDANYLAGALPVYGYFHDVAQHNQMVYPASMLTDMAGKKIKSMTFYPTTGWVDADGDGQYDSGETTYSGINFYGGSITFKLANLSSGTAAFADENATLITGTMTPVKTVTPTRNTSATTWLIEFDQEFTYNGGDLLIDITSTAGTYGHTAFTVDEADGNRGVCTYTYNGTAENFGLDYLPKVTFAYETEGGAAPAVEGGLLRMHLLMVDQLKEEIPTDNSHPDAYGYVLRFEPNGPEGEGKKQSGTVKVDIEKTDAQPNGYYTVNEINNDKNIDTTLLTMNVLDAQVKMNLNDENPNVLYFQMQGAAKNNIPDTYLTQLQYMKNVRKYEEMLEGSAHKGEQYEADKVHYYFNEAKPEVGSYDQEYKAYAPSVSTWGISRRYYEADGLDNTYGAPVWKTAVGNVTVGTCEAQLQVGSNNQPNPATTWEVDGQKYGLYFLSVTAQGYLPNPEVSNIDYEPYMFRVFVENEGGLRNFAQSEDGTHLVDAGAITGQYWLGDFDINSNTWSASDLQFTKGISNDRPSDTNPGWTGNLKFGAPVNMSTDDLKVYVRFYYMVKGWNANSMSLRAGQGEARPGNGAEGEGEAGIGTGVYDLHYQSEIVDQTFINSLGMQSSEPFSGVNIVVTRYSDGTTRTTKVIR
ncbi:MAG: hypothetical protein IJV05_04745 [Muribaculaceae bacterium]|nr:hypothetical protein [Muribaculaceae bacterium]